MNLQVLNSGIQGGGFAGELRLPISETLIPYDVAISAPQNQNDIVGLAFTLDDLPDLEADLWLATIQLENSSVTVEMNGNNVTVGATLNGQISIGWGEDNQNETGQVSSFSLPNLVFQDLQIGGGNVPSINGGSFGLVNENKQGDGVKFPITLNSLDFNFQQSPKIGIVMDLGFTLINVQNGISGNTAFTIWGNWDAQDRVYEFDGVNFNEITIDADVSVAHLAGGINLYDKDEVYGTGFRGWISATIKSVGLGLDAALQIGRTNGENGYRYFYFDILVELPDPGLIIPGTGAALYGFGGGAWYNMKRETVYTQMMVDDFVDGAFSDDAGASPSGVVYKPWNPGGNSAFGFSASVLFGIAGSKAIFNGDLKFGATFTGSYGLYDMFMEGNGYVMQDPTGDRSPEDAFIAANVNIYINFVQPAFSLNAQIAMALGDFVKVNVPINMLFANQQGEKVWFFKLGSWDESQAGSNNYEPWNDPERFMVDIDLKVIAVNLNGYFMIGNKLPPDLPPLPKQIVTFLGDGISDDRDPGIMDAGKAEIAPGIAFGMGIYANLDFKFAIFYADFEFIMGGDVLIKKYNQSCGDYDPIGINGWYAKGQMYAYFKGEVGIEVDLWFWSGKAKLMSLEAGAYLYVQAPNPGYVKGMVKVHGELFAGLIKIDAQMKVEKGEKCDLGQTNPFDDIPIVSELNPVHGEKMVYTGIAPQIAFNYPRGVWTISEFDPDEGEYGEMVERKFEYELKKYEMTYKQGNATKKVNFQEHTYAADGRSRKSLLTEYLPGFSDIDYYLQVKGYEVTSGKVELADEVYQGTFSTKEQPDIIEPQNVRERVPIRNQRFVLQDEIDNPHLYTVLSVCNSAMKPGSPATGMNTYVARYKVLETGQSIDVPCNCAGYKVNYSIPDLDNSKIYSLEIVRKTSQSPNQIAAFTNTKDTYVKRYLEGGGGNGGNGGGGFNIGQLNLQNLNLNNNNQNQLNIQNNNNNNNQNNNIQQGQINLQNLNLNNNNVQQMQINLNLINNNNNNQNQMPQINQVKANNVPPPPPNNWGINGNIAMPNDEGEGIYVEVLDRELKGTKKSNTVEKVLYTYYFKTSAYDDWDSKLSDVDVYQTNYPEDAQDGIDWPGTNEFVQFDMNWFYLEMEENIDRFDAYGTYYYLNNKKYTIEPNVNFTHPVGQNWPADAYEQFIWEAPEEYELWHDALPLYYFKQGEGEWEFDYDYPFPDFEAWWPNKWVDWDEDRLSILHTFGQNGPLPALVEMGNWEGAPMEIWKQGKHTSYQFDVNITKPAGPLTWAEINAAKAKAPKPNQPNLNQLQFQNNQPNIMNMNLQYQANDPIVRVPVLDYSEWLTECDLFWVKEFIRDALDEEYDAVPYQQMQSFNELTRMPIKAYLEWMELTPRLPGIGAFYLNGEYFEYDHN